MKVFAIDLNVCNGCYCCQIACKDEHVGNDWTPYAKPQPDTGQFWLGIDEKVHGHVPHVKVSYTPHLCQHCDEAPCIDVCKAQAISKREDGLVLLAPEQCTGCRLCVDACSYGAIFFNDSMNIAQKCTGCAHLLDSAPDEWTVPRCVDQCPTDALRFGEEEEFKDFIAEAEQLPGGAATKSRVYYKGLPKKFIAGTLYEPATEEVIIGATCTLKDAESKETYVVSTDNFGDFWFRGLQDDRTFTLTLEKDGKSRVLADICTDIDRGLGDIPLELA